MTGVQTCALPIYFWLFALVALAALPLLLFIGKTKLPRNAADRAEAMVIAE